ncbi:aspartic peptidase domain-containing protein [Suillus fuscotomentosus]|uniref:Aspartic peptidase domain-containing protein n=1 Tax=Suillus fuscotomentosus TaxID=1912939 RepID=A0AAD4DYN6_9AGAM|nr:aspartic peptidase domain-containing protein [Suillus fuscotomentosus]XP_041221953.1 aspartic peptidase domain-containing protein [Suillus fuscotomentosus]KAG1894974.1 aspartic peptidase domain-containing protein [Suillus fuscotomentosus]KAG1896377.1 aspartic peptidase domain-containing protein [Suillus fuscotomentosus]
MFPAASLLTILLLALSIVASPVEIHDSPITLSVAWRLNTSGGTINLLQHDQSRATALKTVGRDTLSRRTGSTIAMNDAVCYTAALGIGSPATIYNLIVDTGSSLTWVSATSYVKTRTSVDTRKPISDPDYGSGTEYTDTVTLGNLTIIQQPIGVISTSTDSVVGVIGIGPLDLTEGESSTATIPTVTDSLYSQGIISQIIVSLSFEPTTSESDTNGELSFGGTDATKYTGAVAYT